MGNHDADEGLGLEQAYAVETPDDNRRLYAKWAETYDEDFVRNKQYEYPERVAEIFALAARPDGPVLDVGCGTGAVGLALAARGVDEIDGIDISPEMLAQAAGKGVYGGLLEADLTGRLDIADAVYAGVTSAGTFTHGHLPPEPLDELVRVAKPGARCAIGVNAAHFVEFGFERWFDDAVAAGRIEPYERTLVKVYAESDPDNPDDMSTVVSFTVR